MDPADEPGEHWVALYIDDKSQGEYFDSYGIPPPILLQMNIKRHSTEWMWNQTPLQDVWTLACGHFCVYYPIYCSQDVPMNDITTQLNHIEHNDKYVMDFVNALLQLHLFIYCIK